MVYCPGRWGKKNLKKSSSGGVISEKGEDPRRRNTQSYVEGSRKKKTRQTGRENLSGWRAGGRTQRDRRWRESGVHANPAYGRPRETETSSGKRKEMDGKNGKGGLLRKQSRVCVSFRAAVPARWDFSEFECLAASDGGENRPLSKTQRRKEKRNGIQGKRACDDQTIRHPLEKRPPGREHPRGVAARIMPPSMRGKEKDLLRRK